MTNSSGATGYIRYGSQYSWDVAGDERGWVADARTTITQTTAQHTSGSGSLQLNLSGVTSTLLGGASKTYAAPVTWNSIGQELMAFVRPDVAPVNARFVLEDERGRVVTGPTTVAGADVWTAIRLPDAHVDPGHKVSKIKVEITVASGTYTGAVWLDHVILKGLVTSWTDSQPTPSTVGQLGYDWPRRKTTHTATTSGTTRTDAYTYDGSGRVVDFVSSVMEGEECTEAIVFESGRVVGPDCSPMPPYESSEDQGYEGTGELVNEGPEEIVDPNEPEAPIYDSGPPLPDAPSDDGPVRIIGENNLQRANTRYFPHRTVVKITYVGGGGCSGFMHHSNVVITAAHCLYNFQTRRWTSISRLTPGMTVENGRVKRPYGSCGHAVPLADNRFVTEQWLTSGNHHYDWGMIRLDCNIGSRTGWLKVWNNSYSFSPHRLDMDLNGFLAWVNGYPLVTPRVQKKARGQVTGTWRRLVFYDTDMLIGQSGGPVYTWRDPRVYNDNYFGGCNGRCVFAINAHEYDPPTHNSGVRITPERYKSIVKFRKRQL